MQMLALLRRREGDPGEAEALLRRAVALKPDSVELHVRLGQVLALNGDDAGAAACFRRATGLMPSLAPAHSDLANALHRLGRHAEAVEAQRRALAIAPGHPAYLVNLAVALQGLGRLDEAAAACRQALARAPDLFHAHLNLGSVLEQLGRIAEAERHYRRAHELDPRDARALTNLGNAVLAGGRPEEAVMLQRRAVALAPDLAVAHANLGVALLPLDRAAEAEPALRRALALSPDLADVHKNLGIALEHQGRFTEALAAFERALALDPESAEAHTAHAMALLRQGDFARGWGEYDWRWRTRAARAQSRRFDRPEWSGEDISGRTILLHAEQGLGDTIQFLRYVPMVAAGGTRVVLEVPAPLRRLCARLPGQDRVVAAGEKLPPHDVQCPLLSLPRVFGTRLESIPATPYIQAEPEATRAWKRRLATRPGFRVGLAWAGNPAFPDDRRRSIAPALLAPLLGVGGIAFHSLQVGADAAPPDMRAVEPLGNELRDFADTAACVQALDLLISVDTAVAHLAGALGKPVWIMLPLGSDWRWLVDRTESPWYASARLFRQNRAGDWPAVIDRVARGLAANARGEKS
ncbi:MAG: tetratricopeptide repeat protein [Alphaproteobacteria bacterium]|nr:tetratricopeptide repeat protein [Alphaproteobacteria bacterium]